MFYIVLSNLHKFNLHLGADVDLHLIVLCINKISI